MESKSCSGNVEISSAQERVICAICDTEFVAWEKDEQTYCSLECANEAQRNSDSLEKSVCGYCGSRFESYKSEDRKYCSVECFQNSQNHEPVSYTHEGGHGYEKWYHGGYVAVHQLLAIADGASPHTVFSPEYNVDHVNGCKIDNRHENIQVMHVTDHGTKDGKKNSRTFEHREMLEIVDKVCEEADVNPVDVVKEVPRL